MPMLQGFFFLGFRLMVKMLALLPFFLLYRLSDACYYGLFFVVRYRKKVVLNNLRNAFPEKSETERKQIAKAFYRHLCDVVFEIIKLSTISKKKLSKRVRFKNLGYMDKIRAEGKSCVVISGHYGNWEWLNTAVPDNMGFRTMGVYRPLRNRHFDRFLYRLRSRLGPELVPMRQIYKRMVQCLRNKEQIAVGFISDQCPSWEEIHYWVDFLHQETPVYTGQIRLAQKLNMVVVFYAMRKIRRGYYEVEIIPLSENASHEEPFRITDLHVNLLEKLILEQPQYWLWTHKRWKRTKEEWLQKMKTRRK